MDYITRFYTTAEFTTAEPNLARPHVSLTKDNYVVHYMPVASQGGSQGGDTPSGEDTPVVTHDYVEIAGIKWATCNVGAENPWDTGLYFQWGDTQGYTASQVGDGEGQKLFTFADYKYAELDPSGSNDSGSGSGSGSGGGAYNITKYNETDGKTVLEASDDAVTAACGSSWRMPTTAEFQALGAAVKSAWTADYQGSGVAGLVCTDKTDSSKVLFFPACGLCNNGSVYDVGSYGFYWSSSLYSSDVQGAYYLLFYDGNVYQQDSNDRCNGFPVRGVLDE